MELLIRALSKSTDTRAKNLQRKSTSDDNSKHPTLNVLTEKK